MSQHGPESSDPSDREAPQPNPWQHGAGGRAEPTSPYGTPYGQPQPGYGTPYEAGHGTPPPYAQPPSPGGYPGEQAPANPYDTSPYPASAYGVPYGSGLYGPVAQQHPQATTALILGILGLVVCPPVGIGGFVLGGRARRAIDAEPQLYSGSGLATAGWVLGIISIVETVLMVLVPVLILLGVVHAFGS